MEGIENTPTGATQEELKRAFKFYLEQEKTLGEVSDHVVQQLCENSIGIDSEGIRASHYPTWTNENFKTVLMMLSQEDEKFKTAIEKILMSGPEYIPEKLTTVEDAVMAMKSGKIDLVVDYLKEDKSRLTGFYENLRNYLAPMYSEDGDGGFSENLLEIIKRVL